MSVIDTFKTWSVSETIISVCGLIFAAGLAYVV
jgi:H+/gluconate symporter-like permease